MRLLLTGALAAFALTLGAAASAAAGQPTEREHREALQHLREGQSLLRDERWEKAEEEFRAAVKLDPLLEMAHYGLGQVYMATKRYRAAVKAYLDCREAFHNGWAHAVNDSATARQQTLELIQELEGQKRVLESTRRVSTTDVPGAIHRLDDQIRDLRSRRFDAAAAPPPTPTWISIALGSAYYRSGSLSDAEREYREALRVDPNLGEGHNNLAVVCMQTGRLEEADQELKAAEKSGFRVNSQLKADLKNAMSRR